MDLEELLAREEIRELVAAYCLAVDNQDWTKLESLCTSDFVLELNDRTDGPAPGPENFSAYIRKYRTGEQTSHHAGSQSLVIESPTSASGVWELLYVTRGEQSRLWFGFYEHDYRRVDGRWRIARQHRVNSFSTVLVVE
jgi:ketosteroid isomerase-like protein